MNSKIRKILSIIKENGLDGVFFSSSSNISYLTDYPSRDSLLLVTRKKIYFLTDFRYAQEAKKRLKDVEVMVSPNSIYKRLFECCKKLKLKKIGFEDSYLSVDEYSRLKNELGKGVALVAVANFAEGLREIKGADEIKKLRAAVSITLKAIDYVKDFIAPGIKELEIAGELQRFIRQEGSSGSAFDIIVACGANSAYPHHLTSSRRVKSNEPVLIDIGVDYFGYKSDLTRVLVSGKINSYARRVYDIVAAAGRLAVAKIKPGVRASQIDAAARRYITKKGFGSYFGHALGHGVGLEVHEGPRISKQNNALVKAGMVFTIEPAIYLPGKFGIRIEDMVLVTPKGCEVLSGAFDK
jgi:Xaa-Pro aminopeptidase